MLYFLVDKLNEFISKYKNLNLHVGEFRPFICGKQVKGVYVCRGQLPEKNPNDFDWDGWLGKHEDEDAEDTLPTAIIAAPLPLLKSKVDIYATQTPKKIESGVCKLHEDGR